MNQFLKTTTSKETIFIVICILITLSVAILSAKFDWGYISAAYLAFGMFGVISLFAIIQKDEFLKKLLVFGIAAGFTELIADNWLVNGIDSLVYPATESKIWASPNYMPFAWAVILIEVGYLGYLYSKNHKLIISMAITFLIGMCFIPIFETCAKYAEWWYYVPTKMIANTPIYIIIGEGMICFGLPFIFRKELQATWLKSSIAGILQGLWIFVSYYIAYFICK